MSALRGEVFLTELLIAHAANVNKRDLAGNTPLLYACHFYRQHGNGVKIVSQLLYHKADAHYRVKDGKLAGSSALDIMQKACIEPQMDENAPRQICAMLKLAMEDGEDCHDAITKVWTDVKSQNRKLYQVSSSKDQFGYGLNDVKWVTPAGAKNVQSAMPVQLDASAASILDEKFTNLTDYLFADEGALVKVYVNFPEEALSSLSSPGALQVVFDFQAFDMKLRSSTEHYRLRIDPLYGSIDAERCKHRASAKKVTLTLAKRHSNRVWSSLQKAR